MNLSGETTDYYSRKTDTTLFPRQLAIRQFNFIGLHRSRKLQLVKNTLKYNDSSLLLGRCVSSLQTKLRQNSDLRNSQNSQIHTRIWRIQSDSCSFYLFLADKTQTKLRSAKVTKLSNYSRIWRFQPASWSLCFFLADQTQTKRRSAKFTKSSKTR